MFIVRIVIVIVGMIVMVELLLRFVMFLCMSELRFVYGGCMLRLRKLRLFSSSMMNVKCSLVFVSIGWIMFGSILMYVMYSVFLLCVFVICMNLSVLMLMVSVCVIWYEFGM